MSKCRESMKSTTNHCNDRIAPFEVVLCVMLLTRKPFGIPSTIERVSKEPDRFSLVFSCFEKYKKVYSTVPMIDSTVQF
jgi:hypothetical protein